MFLLKLLLSNDFAGVALYPAVFVYLLFFQFNYTARTIIASLLVVIVFGILQLVLGGCCFFCCTFSVAGFFLGV